MEAVYCGMEWARGGEAPGMSLAFRKREFSPSNLQEKNTSG